MFPSDGHILLFLSKYWTALCVIEWMSVVNTRYRNKATFFPYSPKIARLGRTSLFFIKWGHWSDNRVWICQITWTNSWSLCFRIEILCFSSLDVGCWTLYVGHRRKAPMKVESGEREKARGETTTSFIALISLVFRALKPGESTHVTIPFSYVFIATWRKLGRTLFSTLLIP